MEQSQEEDKDYRMRERQREKREKRGVAIQAISSGMIST